MVSPIELLVVALVVTVSAVVAALWRRRLPTAPESLPRPDEAAGQGPDPGSADAPVGRNLRGLAIALALMPLSSWLALSFAYGYSERPLPVKPPGPASDCGHSSSGDGLLWLAVIAVLVLLQFGPSLVGFLVGRRRAAANRPLPDGQRFLRFGAALAGATLLAVVLRLAVGGVAPSAFTTYGALTPPGPEAGAPRP